GDRASPQSRHAWRIRLRQTLSQQEPEQTPEQTWSRISQLSRLLCHLGELIGCLPSFWTLWIEGHDLLECSRGSFRVFERKIGIPFFEQGGRNLLALRIIQFDPVV